MGPGPQASGCILTLEKESRKIALLKLWPPHGGSGLRAQSRGFGVKQTRLLLCYPFWASSSLSAKWDNGDPYLRDSTKCLAESAWPTLSLQETRAVIILYYFYDWGGSCLCYLHSKRQSFTFTFCGGNIMHSFFSQICKVQTRFLGEG